MASKVDLVLSRSVQTRFYTLNLWDYVLDYLCSIDKTFLTKDRMFEISTALIIIFALVKDISTLHFILRNVCHLIRIGCAIYSSHKLELVHTSELILIRLLLQSPEIMETQ